MINRNMRMARLSKEMQGFKQNPPAGITCQPVVDDVYEHLVARMKGPEGSPYEKGTFTLDINISEKYPMEPPHVKFITRIYHPNIDRAGRICMDMLKMKNDGWLPTISLETLLVAIQYLLTHPNPDDPLVKDIAHEYKYNHDSFVLKAQQHTEQYAINNDYDRTRHPYTEKYAANEHGLEL